MVVTAQAANVMLSGAQPGRAEYAGCWERVSWFLLHLFPGSLVCGNDVWPGAAPALLLRDLFSMFQSCNNPKLTTDKNKATPLGGFCVISP